MLQEFSELILKQATQGTLMQIRKSANNLVFI